MCIFALTKTERMQSAVKPLVILLASLAGLLYIFSIGNAITATFSEDIKPIGFLAEAATVIGGILSTNLGAVLGVTFTQPPNQPLAIGGTPVIMGLRSSIQSKQQRASGVANSTQKLQIIACWVYVLCLLAALVAWLIAQAKDVPHVVPLLPEMAKTLLGVIVGALTVVLGGRTDPKPPQGT
jgi:hypothetical protein